MRWMARVFVSRRSRRWRPGRVSPSRAALRLGCGPPQPCERAVRAQQGRVPEPREHGRDADLPRRPRFRAGDALHRRERWVQAQHDGDRRALGHTLGRAVPLQRGRAVCGGHGCRGLLPPGRNRRCAEAVGEGSGLRAHRCRPEAVRAEARPHPAGRDRRHVDGVAGPLGRFGGLPQRGRGRRPPLPGHLRRGDRVADRVPRGSAASGSTRTASTRGSTRSSRRTRSSSGATGSTSRTWPASRRCPRTAAGSSSAACGTRAAPAHRRPCSGSSPKVIVR